MRNVFITASLLSVTFMASGCQQQSDNAEQTTAAVSTTNVKLAKNNTPPPEELSKKDVEMGQWYTGTLKYYNLEGGFFGFVGDNGERFLPLNLDKKYQQNGAKVRILGKENNDIMTIQQWGTPFTVQKVEIIEAGAKPALDPSKV